MKTRNAILAGMIASLTLAAAAGCSSDQNAVQVVPTKKTSESPSGKMTPLERGKIRRQILDDMEENIRIWRGLQEGSLETAFTKELAVRYAQMADENLKAGKKRVREHDKLYMEVVDLAKDKASVVYRFKNKSYDVSTSTGKKLTQPTNAETLITFTVVKEGGRWKIESALGNKEATE